MVYVKASLFLKKMLPLPKKEQCDFTKNKVGHDLDMKLVSALDFLLYSHDLFYFLKNQKQAAVMPAIHFITNLI